MQIVIDIPDKKYEALKMLESATIGLHLGVVEKAIINGTPLPKGHGALKDTDKLAVAIAMLRDKCDYYGSEYESACYRSYDIAVDEIIDAPTIVEADEEEQK